jgi:hypothetical protein
MLKWFSSLTLLSFLSIGCGPSNFPHLPKEFQKFSLFSNGSSGRDTISISIPDQTITVFTQVILEDPVRVSCLGSGTLSIVQVKQLKEVVSDIQYDLSSVENLNGTNEDVGIDVDQESFYFAHTQSSKNQFNRIQGEGCDLRKFLKEVLPKIDSDLCSQHLDLLLTCK